MSGALLPVMLALLQTSQADSLRLAQQAAQTAASASASGTADATVASTFAERLEHSFSMLSEFVDRKSVV